MKRILTQLRKMEREFEARRISRAGSFQVMRWSNYPLPSETPIGTDDRVIADLIVEFAVRGKPRSKRIVWVRGIERIARGALDWGVVYDGRERPSSDCEPQTYHALPVLGELTGEEINAEPFESLYDDAAHGTGS